MYINVFVLMLKSFGIPPSETLKGWDGEGKGTKSIYPSLIWPWLIGRGRDTKCPYSTGT